MIGDVEYSAHSSRDDNLCKSDAQVNIYLKLLIKSNPVVFLLIEKGLVCTFKSSLEEILVSCYLSYSLKGRSCLKYIMFCAIGTICTILKMGKTPMEEFHF